MLFLRILMPAVFGLLTAVSPAAAMTPDFPPEVTAKLDLISAGCITCHDGSGGPHARFCLLEQRGIGCGGHIVSVSYAALAAENERLREESSLPPQLVLQDGKITCVTCHGAEPHDGMPLVVDNIDSALCRGCHLL